MVLLVLLIDTLGIVCIVFKNHLTKKLGHKYKYLKNEKRFQRDFTTALFIIFKGLSVKQIKVTFLESESPTLSLCLI